MAKQPPASTQWKERLMSEGRARPDRSERGWDRMRSNVLFWPVLITLAYLAVTLTVTVTEYVSEISKIERGIA
jgi:hypothetical protein